MARNITANPQDHTGREKARLEAEAAAKQQEAAARMAMVTAQVSAVKEGVVDVSSGGSVEVPNEDGTGVVTVAKRTKRMRVNTLLENVTIGHGTDYTFEPGQQYKVDEDIYNYLDEKGFVWH